MRRAIFINETLASALKDRFFAESQRDLIAFHKSVAKVRRNFSKRSRWINAVRADLALLNRFCLGTYEGGSKTKPYFVLNALELIPERAYNTWNEKCLFSAQIMFLFKPPQTVLQPGVFTIGEHAVMRLFMRSPVEENADGNILPHSIVRQIEHVPFWSNFWFLFYRVLQDRNFTPPMAPLIPAPNGAFLAEFSKDKLTLEIRTFINDAQLTKDRKSIRDLMLAISTPLLQSPMSAPIGIRVDDFGVFMLLAVVCKQLAPQADTFAEITLINAEVPQKMFCVRALEEFGTFSGDLWKDFETMPLREFLTMSNHMMRTLDHAPITALRRASSGEGG